ncbi:hypothetical protein [Echinicola sp. 20G]|uniref:hypothetical protein n=1 Tax=Echinicola sp. 20G TaxID=2781961 RepID=UPI0019103909|nr:hypothetical protein [Echinicola sp. 20G]
MKVTFFILVSFVLIFKVQAQDSDLELASHQYEYIGDSIELKKILSLLQSDSLHVLEQNNQICELKIKGLGESQSIKFRIYSIEYGSGVSCRGISKTVFFKENNFIGYINSDMIAPEKVDGDHLIWKFENGTSVLMDLSEKIPPEFHFEKLKLKLVMN